MVAYRMDIISKTGLFSFGITPTFFPGMQFKWKRNGFEVAVLDTVPVRGWFSEDDPDVVFTNWNTLKAIAQNGSPVVFKFVNVTSGLTKHQYNRGHITDLRTVDHGGGFVNHLEFTFNITEERGVTFPNLVDVNRDDENVKRIDEEGTVKTTFLRRVSATGVNGELGPAKSFVLALKPTQGKLRRQSIKEVHFDGTVIGVWEMDTTEEEEGDDLSGIRKWNESARLSPGQRGNRWYRRGAVVPEGPALIRGGPGPSAVSVRGQIEAYDESSFPNIGRLIQFMQDQVQGRAETLVVLENPQFGTPFPIEFDPDDPKVPTVFQMNYGYRLDWGEAGVGTQQIIPRVRHVGRQS